MFWREGGEVSKTANLTFVKYFWFTISTFPSSQKPFLVLKKIESDVCMHLQCQVVLLWCKVFSTLTSKPFWHSTKSTEGIISILILSRWLITVVVKSWICPLNSRCPCLFIIKWSNMPGMNEERCWIKENTLDIGESDRTSSFMTTINSFGLKEVRPVKLWHLNTSDRIKQKWQRFSSVFFSFILHSLWSEKWENMSKDLKTETKFWTLGSWEMRVLIFSLAPPLNFGNFRCSTPYADGGWKKRDWFEEEKKLNYLI